MWLQHPDSLLPPSAGPGAAGSAGLSSPVPFTPNSSPGPSSSLEGAEFQPLGGLLSQLLCHLAVGSTDKHFGSLDYAPAAFYFFFLPSFLFKALPVILSFVLQTSFAVVLVEGPVAGLPMGRLTVKCLPGTIRENSFCWKLLFLYGKHF